MQTLIQHITKLVASATALASEKSWTLNYGIQMSDLGGDRFEPMREGSQR